MEETIILKVFSLFSQRVIHKKYEEGRYFCMTKYKTVALGHLEGKTGQNADKVLAPVALKIQDEAQGGWEFINMYNMPIWVKPGCLASLFGNKGGTDYYYMLVFKKED